MIGSCSGGGAARYPCKTGRQTALSHEGPPTLESREVGGGLDPSPQAAGRHAGDANVRDSQISRYPWPERSPVSGKGTAHPPWGRTGGAGPACGLGDRSVPVRGRDGSSLAHDDTPSRGRLHFMPKGE